MLQKMGCDSEIVENGSLVIEKLNQGDFDLILMDCSMPVMDGYEATKVVRSLSTPSKSIPIVAVTAGDLNSDEKLCFEIGMNAYLTKPVHYEDLKKTVKSLLQHLLKEEFTPPVSIDWSVLEDLDKMDTSSSSISLEIVSSFRKNVYHRLDSLNKAIIDKNQVEIKKESHALKSSSAYIGAIVVQDICEKISSYALESKFDKVHSIYEALQKEITQILSLLNQRFPPPNP